MVAKIQIRRDTTANWESANTVLGIGEFGLEIETKKLKIGDGTTPWNKLGYIDGEYVHLEGDETVEGTKAFVNGIITRGLVLLDSDGARIKNNVGDTFIRASEGGSVFISGYGDNKKIEFRPKGDDNSNDAVTINTDGSIIGNKFIGTADKAIKDSLNRNISETYALKSEIPTIPTKVSQLENDSNFQIATNTLSGYGIIDAKIENGAITLGENTITPLVEHQDVSDKADKSYVDTELGKKQDTISDLTDIRSGAALGATALQSIPSTYALKTDIPTNLSSLNNDIGYITAQDVSDKADKSYVDTELGKKQDTISDLTDIRSGAALGATALQSIPSTYALKSNIPTRVSQLSNDSNYVNNTQLSNQLSNKIDKNGTLNAFVIGAGTTETGWYRIWSDGFKEEGGTTLSSVSDEITLTNAFTDENYTVIVTPYTSTELTITKNDVDSFSITSTSECIKSWEVKGY